MESLVGVDHGIFTQLMGHLFDRVRHQGHLESARSVPGDRLPARDILDHGEKHEFAMERYVGNVC